MENTQSIKPVVFIIPLKSKVISKNWEEVVSLCRDTLTSIYNQSCPEFVIFLICNRGQAPNLSGFDERLNIVEDDFKIPQNIKEIYYDIKVKIKRGLIAGKNHVDHFFMRLDADDLIHKNLVDYVSSRPDKNGWYIPWGYMYKRNSKNIYIRPNFHVFSGSSHIIKLREEDFPEDMSTADDEYLVDFWQHLAVKNILESRGRKLDPLPFKGALYLIGHNESIMLHKIKNFSGLKRTAWKLLFRRKLSRKMIDDFSISSNSQSLVF